MKINIYVYIYMYIYRFEISLLAIFPQMVLAIPCVVLSAHQVAGRWDSQSLPGMNAYHKPFGAICNKQLLIAFDKSRLSFLCKPNCVVVTFVIDIGILGWIRNGYTFKTHL